MGAEAVAKHCLNLVEINLNNTSVTEKGFIAIVEKCPLLHRIGLAGNRIQYERVIAILQERDLLSKVIFSL